MAEAEPLSLVAVLNDADAGQKQKLAALAALAELAFSMPPPRRGDTYVVAVTVSTVVPLRVLRRCIFFRRFLARLYF